MNARYYLRSSMAAMDTSLPGIGTRRTRTRTPCIPLMRMHSSVSCRVVRVVLCRSQEAQVFVPRSTSTARAASHDHGALSLSYSRI
jgi:hypothetical protein